jgi:hypothetical protein
VIASCPIASIIRSQTATPARSASAASSSARLALSALASSPAAISTRIDVTSRPYRFIERLVVLDSQKIDTLLVIPL